MATKKAKKKAGPQFVKRQYLAVCTDGKTVADFEKEGAAKAGISVEEWRKRVVAALAAADAKGVNEAFAKGEGTTWSGQGAAMAGRFNKMAEGLTTTGYDSPDKLQDLLEGRTPGLSEVGVDKVGYNKYKRPMWTYLKKQGLVEDRNWQHTSAVSWVSGGKRVYATNMIPYFVKRSGTAYNYQKGAIIKLVDGKDPTNFAYAQVLGVGPSGDPKMELSQGAWKYLGYDADGKSVPSGASSVGHVQVAPGGVSANPSAMLSGDQIQLAGSLGEAGLLSKQGNAITVDDLQRSVDALDEAKQAKLDKTMNEGARRALKDLKDKKADQKQSDATPGGGGPKLLKGFQTVYAGENLRRVGYADAKCIHEAGGHVAEGSHCVFVGKHPLSRIGDGTSDQLEVKSGNETIFVGGESVSAVLVA